MKSKPFTGPEPTIEQLREQFGWMLACCGIQCSHRAALASNSLSMAKFA
jgi:hypothetical protein